MGILDGMKSGTKKRIAEETEQKEGTVTIDGVEYPATVRVFSNNKKREGQTMRVRGRQTHDADVVEKLSHDEIEAINKKNDAKKRKKKNGLLELLKKEA